MINLILKLITLIWVSAISGDMITELRSAIKEILSGCLYICSEVRYRTNSQHHNDKVFFDKIAKVATGPTVEMRLK